MSGDSTELMRHRRNLMIVSVALLLYEFSEGTVDTISIMGGGLKLGNPEAAVFFAYGALLYFLWRFWVHASGEHGALKIDVQSTLETPPFISPASLRGTCRVYSGTDHVLFRPSRRGSFDNPERRVLPAPATPITPSDVSSLWKAGFAPLLI
jgi:hypothetical protein